MSDFDDSWYQQSQAGLPAQTAAKQQSYKKAWQQQLEAQAAAKQQAWQTQRGLTLGAQSAGNPWSLPGVNAPYPNALLSRFPVQSLTQADPGNALAGYWMGNTDMASNPMLMHQLLGSQPGFLNV